MNCQIIGVHEIDAPEPCHLIEVELADPQSFDSSQVTQRDDSQPAENWQVAYDEQPVSDDQRRWVFFVHYLNLARPLDTADGQVAIPPVTPLPDHLDGIEYWAP